MCCSVSAECSDSSRCRGSSSSCPHQSPHKAAGGAEEDAGYQGQGGWEAAGGAHSSTSSTQQSHQQVAGKPSVVIYYRVTPLLLQTGTLPLSYAPSLSALLLYCILLLVLLDNLRLKGFEPVDFFPYHNRHAVAGRLSLCVG